VSKQLRHALLDLVWAHDLEAMRGAYRALQNKDLAAHEREVAATLFNNLIHIWVVAP
jgi:hypothetical protein